ncbi:bifunctional p-450/nadph-p450 reductase [Lasius niger]|uniref:Bifunctional p-450/nadph-p450 reductase n=1 Tax=Lasius niger TaxID=67767 RepID=A0A0J7NNM3_LASNI|nr:bifunctional p-450/nadph-p450 reductase [Lasius niger]
MTEVLLPSGKDATPFLMEVDGPGTSGERKVQEWRDIEPAKGSRKMERISNIPRNGPTQEELDLDSTITARINKLLAEKERLKKGAGIAPDPLEKGKKNTPPPPKKTLNSPLQPQHSLPRLKERERRTGKE